MDLRQPMLLLIRNSAPWRAKDWFERAPTVLQIKSTEENLNEFEIWHWWRENDRRSLAATIQSRCLLCMLLHELGYNHDALTGHDSHGWKVYIYRSKFCFCRNGRLAWQCAAVAVRSKDRRMWRAFAKVQEDLITPFHLPNTSEPTKEDLLIIIASGPWKFYLWLQWTIPLWTGRLLVPVDCGTVVTGVGEGFSGKWRFMPYVKMGKILWWIKYEKWVTWHYQRGKDSPMHRMMFKIM